MTDTHAGRASLLAPEQARHAPTAEQKRQATIDLTIRILIWATIATVVAIAFAVGLFIAQQLLGALQALAFPLALVALAWAGFLQRQVLRMRKQQAETKPATDPIAYQ